MPGPPRPAPRARMRLGELLLDRGLASESQVEAALREQARAPAPLGAILVRMGALAPGDLARTLAEQGGFPFVDPSGAALPPEILAKVPEALARRLRVLPLALEGGRLRLAMADPFDLDAIGEVEARTGLPVEAACAAEDALRAKLSEAYGESGTVEEALEAAIAQADGHLRGRREDQPIARLVDQLLAKALRDRATDLHVQPEEGSVLTRYRVDGDLRPGPALPKGLQAAVTARLKVLAEADVAESRLPQDGRFSLPRGGRAVDVRASFLPVRHGEKVVLRFLDPSGLAVDLGSLGMPEGVLAPLLAMLERPHGMILATGPTGSGKTTTLYAALQRLDASRRCIVTVEDPVEYGLPQVAQMSVNVKAGRTFAAGLRAILRQDPDVILVGEIRDGETASMALRAAMTGHLVLATLHANDPAGALPRLRDLGASPLDLAASLLGIHAQRLLRLNCPGCAVADGPWRRGAGCPSCAFTGVKGRRAVHDLLVFTPEVRARVAAGAAPADIEALARAQGKASLRENALELARAGLVSHGEALRATAED